MAQLVGLGAAAVSIVAIVIRHWYVRSHPEESGAAPAESGPPTTAVPESPAAA